MLRHFYSTTVETVMKSYYSRLSEKDRRIYVALESQKLGWGGKAYLCRLFETDRKTLLKGVQEILNPSLLTQIPPGKQRKRGGGRKKILP